ncbi:MAG: 8-amino-7-oxononanoate synthase [Peptococcaceae bacterium]|nr:MAG: 8-amino-7-oxononanoate synthase [Peptococcaceae bacterium]
MDFLRAELEHLQKQNLFRRLKRLDGPQAARTTVEDRPCILLSSNNYLGLADHPALKEAAVQAVNIWGAGAGGSRLTTGNYALFEELENTIARFKRTAAAIVFSTGYMANAGTITALVGDSDVIISDELNHASIIDGCRLSRAKVMVCRHADTSHLAEILNQCHHYRRRLIVTDGVFSMDGDLAPLPEIIPLAERHDALLMVDDAHATGVLGRRGAGTVEHFRLEGRVPVQMGTLSKALGSAGGYVAGSEELIDYLRNKARSFIFSTAPPPAAAGAAREAIRLVEQQPELRQRLKENALYLRGGLAEAGYRVPDGESPIIPVHIGDAAKTMRMADELLERGVFVTGIRPPSVPPGGSRLRVTVMATHTREELAYALQAFQEAGKKSGLI